MNVPLKTGDKDMDAKFVKEAKERDLQRTCKQGTQHDGAVCVQVSTMLCQKEGVEALVAFMKKFEEENA